MDVSSIEAVKGTSYADTLRAGTFAATLDGGGGAGQLFGGAGNDTLIGGGGNDQLTGGAGSDTLTGGTGSDRFLFASSWGADSVTDFTRTQDKIVFQGVDGLTSFAALTISAAGADADIAFGGQHILLRGVAAQSLTASDFLFV